jgi:hypothetical protein
MKRWISLAVVLCMILFIGCKKDSNDNSNPAGNGNGTTHDGTISATISGDISVNFQCSAAYGIQGTGDAGQGTSGVMQFQGTMTQGSDTYMIDIQVYHDPATGTYQFAFPPVDAVGTIAKNSTGNFSESGSVTFTQVSASRMAGTFSFTAFRMTNEGQKVTVNVASGTFNVPVIASN